MEKNCDCSKLSSPGKEKETEASQTLFTKFSMKALFGFTDKLEPGASKQQVVLKGLRNVNGDIDSHVCKEDEKNRVNEEADLNTVDLLPETVQGESNAQAIPEADTRDIFVWKAVSGMDDCVSNDPAETITGASNVCRIYAGNFVDSEDNGSIDNTPVDYAVVSDDHQADIYGTRDLETQQREPKEPSLSDSYSSHSPLFEFSKQDDKDSILVQGTLAHTTSDTELDNEATDLEAHGNITNYPVLSCAVSLEDNDQNKEDTELYTEMGSAIAGDNTEPILPSCKWPSKETGDTIPEVYSNTKVRTPIEENISSIATAKDIQEAEEEQESLSSNCSTDSPTKPASSEKSFQLPAFFSGLRVRKKGLTADPEETLTEIKQKDSDLAMLKLRQPVKKSNLAPETITKKKISEPKGSPTFLEQLSQLLAPKPEEKSIDEVVPASGEVQERKSYERTDPCEEMKPSPAESALDAFKALFTRPPKKETTADTSELEAIKRKMKHEKESLMAIFEKPKSGDVATETNPAEVIPSEQDDKTPGRLQTVWPPPKAKDEEEKIGLKYTEAEYHAVILQLKREHKDEIEKLKSEFELDVFRIRGEHALTITKLEEHILDLKNELENKLYKQNEEAKDACVSTEDDNPPKTYRNVCIQTDRETFIKPNEEETRTPKNNQKLPKKLSKPYLNNSVLTSADRKEIGSSDHISGNVFSKLDQTVPPPPPPPPLPFSLSVSIPPQPPPLPTSLKSAHPPPPPPPPPLPSAFGVHQPSLPPPPGPPPPGTGVPPPLPPPLGSNFSSMSQGPRKPAVEPSCLMRPLYWNRIQISDSSQQSLPTLWDSLEEPNLCDTNEFEYLFSKETAQEKKKALAESYEKKTKTKKIIKLLDGKRSQTVGILISSLHLEMKDIEQAVLNVDDSVVDLETLEALYENRAQKDELAKIKQHYHTSTEEEVKLLDKPEQFLYELSQISNFAERAQCIIFQSVFNEGIIAVQHKVDIIHHVCKGLITMESVKNVLALILAFGNYMNGGNKTRGQADGFGLEILPKLKDVKSRDTGISLADYVVIYYLRHFDKEAGTENSVFPLPEPQDFFQASQVKFEDLIKDLRKLKKDLEGCEKQMKVVFRESPEEHLQPFKDKFEDFFCEAIEEHKAEKSHLDIAQKCFEEMVKYYGIKPKSGEKETTPNYVFMVWYEFCSEFKTIWKRENKNISKERLRMAQQTVSKLTSEKKVETRKINPNASLKEKLRQKEAGVPPN
ncbi:formin-1 [Erythrolamprus reginae]|uniref:formin-1 n=1 Tax=Erythrolamprus reginae TaxID=121349 RepID=UPI00396CAD62